MKIRYDEYDDDYDYDFNEFEKFSHRQTKKRYQKTEKDLINDKRRARENERHRLENEFQEEEEQN